MAEEIKRGPGRPTDKRKDTILRLRIDTDTHELLSKYAKQKVYPCRKSSERQSTVS